MPKNQRINPIDLIRRVSRKEQQSAGTEFIAPITGPGDTVTVRVAGVICHIQDLIDLPDDFSGFAILRLVNHRQAAYVEPADLLQVETYLRALRRVKMVLVRSGEESTWLATALYQVSQAVTVAGVVPVGLVEEGLQPFDVINARTNGARFWYESRDYRRDPAYAERLRTALSSGTKLDQLDQHGLTPGERIAYAVATDWEKAVTVSSLEERVAAALAHTGSRLLGVQPRYDLLVVAFELDGETRQVLIRPDDLTVESAGICLDGHDREFDLTSLVEVLREGNRRNRPRFDITGDGSDEDDELY